MVNYQFLFIDFWCSTRPTQDSYRLVPGTSYPTTPQTGESKNLNALGVYDSLRNGGPLTGASELGAQHPLQDRIEKVSDMLL